MSDIICRNDAPCQKKYIFYKEKYMKNTILFDLDGTLLDTLTDLTNAVNHGLRAVGLPECDSREVASFLGDGYVVLMERACKGRSDLASESLKHFTAYYAEHLEDNTVPYAGVTDSLKALAEKGRKMAIVSNKGDAAVKVLCAKFFHPYVTEFFGVTDTMPKKPAPDMLYAAMRALGSERDDCVMVGDGEPDICMARSAGIDIVSVTWGFRTEEYLRTQGGRVFLHDPKQLADL